MNGVNWKTIGEAVFEDIVDTLLSYEFGDRGQPIEGRGGEGATPGDYSVDDGDVVFEYKYFPEGFPASGSRQTQIKKSFKKVSKRKPVPPTQWILVVPTKLTFWEQKFMNKLAGTTGINVTWRDKVWLNQALIDRPEVANYYRHRSDDTYLMEKAALLKDSALIARPGDIARRVQRLVEDMGDADPHWGWDVSGSHTGEIVQTLVPKHANAALLSPVSLSFKSTLPANSTEVQELRKTNAFGQVKPVTIPGDLIKEFTVSGPPIVAEEGPVHHLVIHPPPPSQWIDIDLTLTDEDETTIGSYFTRGQFTTHGGQGVTLKIIHTPLLTMNYRIPYQVGPGGGVDFSFDDVSGAKVQDVFDATDFACQLAVAHRLRLRTPDGQLALIDVTGRFESSALNDYKFIRSVADDLLVIENRTHVKFRYPQTLDSEDRVNIRNVRLMLEGHCVAHPTYNVLTMHLSGTRDDGLDTLLTEAPFWLIRQTDEATLNLLDVDIKIKNLCFGGIFTIDPDELGRINTALDQGTAAGMALRLRCRPKDRIRMLISDDPPSAPREIDPWNLDGFNQKGLRADGTPFDSENK